MKWSKILKEDLLISLGIIDAKEISMNCHLISKLSTANYRENLHFWYQIWLNCFEHYIIRLTQMQTRQNLNSPKGRISFFELQQFGDMYMRGQLIVGSMSKGYLCEYGCYQGYIAYETDTTADNEVILIEIRFKY